MEKIFQKYIGIIIGLVLVGIGSFFYFNAIGVLILGIFSCNDEGILICGIMVAMGMLLYLILVYGTILIGAILLLTGIIKNIYTYFKKDKKQVIINKDY